MKKARLEARQMKIIEPYIEDWFWRISLESRPTMTVMRYTAGQPFV